MSRFKTGDRVSVALPQITGARKRPTAYTFGVIIDPAADLPKLPLHGGFRYVQIDGTSERRMCYVGKLHHLDEAKV